MVKAGHGHGHGHGPDLSGGGRVVMMARSVEESPELRDVLRFGPAVPVATRPGSFQLNPAVAVGPDGAVLVAWSELDTAGKRVVFVRREPETGAR